MRPADRYPIASTGESLNVPRFPINTLSYYRIIIRECHYRIYLIAPTDRYPFCHYRHQGNVPVSAVFTSKGNSVVIGTVWTLRKFPKTNNWKSVVWSKELKLFTAICNGDTIATSPDGVSWECQKFPKKANWQSHVWCKDLETIVAISSDKKIALSKHIKV